VTAAGVLLGVNLKAYFGDAETAAWCTALAELVSRHPGAGLVEFFVLPAAPSLPTARSALASSGVALGAQDVSEYGPGPHTGEISASVLRDVGCRFVAVGHAERRHMRSEGDGVVRAKMEAALDAGLVPVLCVGEPTHVDPPEAAERTVRQVSAALASLESDSGEVVVAYEPVWAIGGAEAASASHVRHVVMALRREMAVRGVVGRIIYGGSAGPGLLTELHGAVDGLFLGRSVHGLEAMAAVLDEVERLTTSTESTRRPTLPAGARE
jgi:triosephosphate isomerase